MDDFEFSEKTIKAAQYAKALGHPVRFYIMALLSNQSCCYSGDLTTELPIAKSTLSQHLKELKEVGLIQGKTEAPKIRYCINRDKLKEAELLLSELFKTNIRIS